MSQTKISKLVIKNREEAAGRTSVGANMVLTLDGVPMKGVSFFKFEVKSGSVAKVIMEMYAEVEIEVNTPLETVAIKETDLKNGDKPLALYQVGNYEPAKIVTQTKCKKCKCGSNE